MIRRLLHIALGTAAILAAAPTASAQKSKTVLDINGITDSNIIYPESYELDTQKMFEGWYLKNYTATDDRYKTHGDVEVSDAVIRDRLAKLNTVIEMPFNQIIKSYIERYTKKGRGGVAAMLGLSIYYMPIFEQALEEAGLPLELKYLPVIESGLNPNAVSKHGATGLWQFMLVTGKGVGLEVSSLVDERRDPYASSQKAVKYLKSLYDTYGDWSLAIAAYNCGPGTVNKAIRRAGGDPKSHDFWSIYYYLPSETRGYFPMFVAANYVMNYYQYHNISPVLATKPLVTDTLMISNRVHFNQIAHVLDIPIDELRVLNPQFRADVIPGRPDRQYTLVLPSQQIHAYLMSENDILGYESAKYAQRIEVEPGEMPGESLAREIEREGIDETPLEPAPTPAPAIKKVEDTGKGTKTVSHKVQPGETLASIAQLYNVSQDQIKIWNNLSRNSLRTGQQLRITTTPALAEAAGAREVAPETKKQTSQAPRQDNQWKKEQTAQSSKQKETKKPAADQAKDSKKNTAAAQPANNKKKANSNEQQANNTKQNTNNKKANSNEQQANNKKKTNANEQQANNKKGTASQTANKQDQNAQKKGNQTANQTASNKKGAKAEETKKGKNVADSKKKKEEPKAPAEHSIKSGENLTTIAKKYGTTVDELKKANNLKGDAVRAGDNLKLPGKQNAKTSKTADKKEPAGNKKDAKASNAKKDTKTSNAKASKAKNEPAKPAESKSKASSAKKSKKK